jgi:hypothetical protein
VAWAGMGWRFGGGCLSSGAGVDRRGARWPGLAPSTLQSRRSCLRAPGWSRGSRGLRGAGA